MQPNWEFTTNRCAREYFGPAELLDRLAYFTPGLKRNGLDVILSELSGSVADDPPKDR